MCVIYSTFFNFDASTSQYRGAAFGRGTPFTVSQSLLTRSIAQSDDARFRYQILFPDLYMSLDLVEVFGVVRRHEHRIRVGRVSPSSNLRPISA